MEKTANKDAQQAANDSSASEKSKTERIYQMLRNKIRSLELPPGSRLKKVELAEQFDMSRAPVSDAIARLAQEGLVDVYPQSGSYVAPIRPEVIYDSMLARMGLETEALRAVAAKADDALIEELENNLVQQEKAIERDDMAKMDDLDTEFHEIIHRRLNSPRLSSWLDICRAQLDRPRFHALPEDGRAAATVKEHRRIVDAIITRDPEFAAAAMRVHLTKVGEAIDRTLQDMDLPDE